MEYELFVDKIARMIEKNLPKGWESSEISIMTVNKINQVRTGLCFAREEVKHAPTVYLEELYERYKEGMSVEEVVEELQRILIQSDQEKRIPITKDWLAERMDQIVLELINTKENEEYLKDLPHREFQDLSVVYIWYVPYDGGIATIPINYEICKLYGFSEEDLYEMALKNTKEQLPFVIKTMEETLESIYSEHTEEPPEENRKDAGTKMFVVSNTEKSFGASAMLYPEYFETLAEQLGVDLYILPCSRHELIAIPKSEVTLDFALEMMEANNEMQQDKEDLLSHNVYQYDRGERVITMASDVAHRSFAKRYEEEKATEKATTKEGKTR